LLISANPEVDALQVQTLAAPFLEGDETFSWDMLPLDTAKLRSAVERLLADDPHVRATFSHDFGQSGILSIDDALRRSTAVSIVPGSSERIATNLFTAQKATRASLALAADDAQEAQEAFSHLLSTQQRLAHLRKRAERGLGLSSQPDGQMHLTEADMAEGKDAMHKMLERRLVWWKLPLGRADDVFADLQQCSFLFGRSLENKVFYLVCGNLFLMLA
jgi:hypothetical protein